MNFRTWTSTTMELKYIAEKNALHDAFAVFCFFFILFLQPPFGCFWYLICIVLLTISLMAMAANLDIREIFELGQVERIPALCRMKPVSYFLMLHCLTHNRVRVVLKHMEMGEDLRMHITQSIYFQTANEVELMNIVTTNVVIGIGYSSLCLILGAITRSNLLYLICARISYYILYGAAVNGLIALAIQLGHGDLTREWCRTKAVSYFLMLHYHTRGRARLVLPKLECERREGLQRMEDKRRKDEEIGEIVSFKKDICRDRSCMICFKELKVSERVRIVRRCNHCFHASCFQRWLYNKKKTCPSCNAWLL